MRNPMSTSRLQSHRARIGWVLETCIASHVIFSMLRLESRYRRSTIQIKVFRKYYRPHVYPSELDSTAMVNFP
jgi:hypothetical protein